MFEAAKESLWLAKLSTALHVAHTPLILMSDNTGAIALTKNPKHHACTKHWDVRLKWLRERVTAGQFRVNYMPTTEQLADIFTKPLPRPRFEHLRARLHVLEIPMDE